MNKLLVKLIRNRNNGQINLSVPKRRLNIDIKKKMECARKAWIKFEGFE